ncbi:MAG: glycosyltransferase family 4 protein [Gammaproteobacteria bacterium]|nr:glycosyltransferase family 4 protein [Gammaproteobacteria bacterium]
MNHQVHIQNPTPVWINARFLERAVTGVERVGFELISALAAHNLDANGIWSDGSRSFQFKLVAPVGKTADSPWPNIALVRAGRFRGHAWEQFDLPRLTRNDWLINLCNTGPLFKRRQLMFLHDAQPFAIPQNFSTSFGLWYRTLFKIAGHRAARVLVNSHFTKSELCTHANLDATKMDVCHLGTEHVHRVEPANDVEQKFKLPDQKFVLAVSSANPNKNFSTVLSALEQLGDTAPPCVIVGHREQKHFDQVQLDPDRVHHLGYVTDAELLALYQRALCLLFPSFYEGFGLPPLEAMAMGCPVIASCTGAMPEVCGDSVAYCNPQDPASLANAIAGVQSCTSLRASMTSAGRDRSANFTWESAGRTVLDSLSCAVREQDPTLVPQAV